MNGSFFYKTSDKADSKKPEQTTRPKTVFEGFVMKVPVIQLTKKDGVWQL